MEPALNCPARVDLGRHTPPHRGKYNSSNNNSNNNNNNGGAEAMMLVSLIYRQDGDRAGCTQAFISCHDGSLTSPFLCTPLLIAASWMDKDKRGGTGLTIKIASTGEVDFFFQPFVSSFPVPRLAGENGGEAASWLSWRELMGLRPMTLPIGERKMASPSLLSKFSM